MGQLNQKPAPVLWLSGGLLLIIGTLLGILSIPFAWAGSSWIVVTPALSVLAALVWLIHTGGKESIPMRRQLMAVVIAGTWIVFGFFFAKATIDFSWDGQAYHQEAVLLIHDGWHVLQKLPEATNHARWIDSYPKANWTAAAAIYGLTKDIQIGKMTNVIFWGATLMWVWATIGCLLPQRLTRLAGLLAFPVALDPVVAVRLPSYYIDGQISGLLVIALCLVLLRLKQAIPVSRFLWMFSLAMIYAVNLKFTAVVYFGIFTAIAIGCLWFREKRFRIYFFPLAAAGILGIAVLGANPYITNTLRFGHPFHPIMGAAKVDFISAQTPVNLRGLNRFEKFFWANFGKRAPAPEANRLACPIPLTWDQWAGKRWYGSRLGGFGIGYPLVFYLACLTGLGLLIFDRHTLYQAAVPLLLIVPGMVTNPHFWLARYAPQVWLIPLCVLIAAISSQNAGLRRLAGVGMAVALAGSLWAAAMTGIETHKATAERSAELSQLQAAGTVEMFFKDQMFISQAQWLEDNGVHVIIRDSLEQLPCNHPESFSSNYRETFYCIEEGNRSL
jgi:hypothetical protein